MSGYKTAFKRAFPYTIPVLTGYLFIGIAFGVMYAEKGTPCFSASHFKPYSVRDITGTSEGHARDILRTSSGILAISLRIVFAEKPSISATSETLYISLTTFYTRDNRGTF